jgi:hypothetical protein
MVPPSAKRAMQGLAALAGHGGFIDGDETLTALNEA